MQTPQTKPELLIDLLCQHRYYDNHPRPTKEEFKQFRELCGNPALEEMHMAITNLVARQDEFPNPPMHTLRIIGFKRTSKGPVCDIGQAKAKKAKEGSGEGSYWSGHTEWVDTFEWFQSLMPSEREALKTACIYWLKSFRDVSFAAHAADVFGPKSPGRHWLMHRRQCVLKPHYGDFCARYPQILREQHETLKGAFQPCGHQK